MNCLRNLPDTKSQKLSILRSTPFRQFDSTETYYLIIKLAKLFFSEVKSSSAAVSTGLCTVRSKFYTYVVQKSHYFPLQRLHAACFMESIS